VTVTGEISGSVILPLDETDYTYPTVEIKTLRVWTKEEEPPRIRPYIGPSPYWGPYWRPWPYYW
jgi:outer membrane lipoprotein